VAALLMSFLFFDIETSDLLRRDIPLGDQNQPWIVSIAAELVDSDGNHIAGMDTKIRSDGRRIRAGAEEVHGISNRAAARSGRNEIVALGFLIGLATEADYAVAYTGEFSRDCVSSVLMRRGKSVEIWCRPGLQFIDCKQAAAPFCKIPAPGDKGGYARPPLAIAVKNILDEDIPERPEPRQKIQYTKRIFFKLLELKALDIAA
jgi:DNA polymerase-3 subunit epsilon